MIFVEQYLWHGVVCLWYWHPPLIQRWEGVNILLSYRGRRVRWVINNLLYFRLASIVTFLIIVAVVISFLIIILLIIFFFLITIIVVIFTRG